MVAPPYAWYRGVASAWDQPLWREKYTEEVTNIARIALVQRPTDAEAIVGLSKVMSERREFVESLPDKVSQELRASFAALPDAFTTFQVRNTCLVFGNASVLAEAEKLLREDELKMARTPQLLAVWEEYKENEKQAFQLLYVKMDVEKITWNRERLFKVTQGISIATENSWGQLKKACAEMKVSQETGAKNYNRTLWDALFAEIDSTGVSTKPKPF